MNIKELYKKIKHGARVCTSNRRLARHISATYDRLMLLEGLKAWETPGVMEFGEWLSSLLTEEAGMGVGGTLLSKARALVLWEEVVSKDPELSKKSPGFLPYKASLVRESFEAYELLKEHKAALPKNNIYLTEEARALKRWSVAYERLLSEKGFICPSMTRPLVAGLIEKREIQLQGELIFAGFEDISPALASLASAIKKSGVSLSFWPGDIRDEDNEIEGLVKGAELYSFPDMLDEVVHAARWAREKAGEGGRVGVIVTNLALYKDFIEREFASELTPASVLLDGAGSISETFNISMAAPLSESPIVKAALELLTITEPARAKETELMWEVMKSPYLHASREEYFSLEAVDARFRRNNRSEVSLYALSRALSNEEGEALNGFRDRLDLFIKALEKKTNGRSREAPSAWAGRFFAELKGFGWPGRALELTSREFQAFEAFNDLLAEFAGLDDIIGALTRSEAAVRLVRMAGARTHQPRSPETAVEVIGINESIGFEFDSIRILGADDGSLPPGAEPNPFIPISMQKELKLRRASPELAAALAKERLKRLLKAAPCKVVSYPELTEGKEARVSPYFSSLSKNDTNGFASSMRLKDSVHASSLLEDMASDGVIAFVSGEMESLKGGTSILKDQSACPFKAFATYRLGARKLDLPEAGLSPMEKGSILHSALKLFWEEVGDSVMLNKLIRSDGLVQRIRLSVDKALKPYFKGKPAREQHLNLEKERLYRLLSEWLRFEASREPFVVENLEREDEREISGLNIKFRIDRVDSIPALGHAVIDYKSGICNRNDWLGTRPKDPQMLVYNLTGPYEALAFALVKPVKCKFHGIAKSEGILPGNKGFDGDKRIKDALAADNIESFDDLTDSWRKVVETLAKDFVEGVSIVDPAKWGSVRGQSACVYSHCDLKPICRIFEAEEGFTE